MLMLMGIQFQCWHPR